MTYDPRLAGLGRHELLTLLLEAEKEIALQKKALGKARNLFVWCLRAPDEPTFVRVARWCLDELEEALTHVKE